MTRKIFIGSSSEGFSVAEQLENKLKECSDWLHCDKWSDGGIFALNTSALNSLVKASRKYDYGVFVATKDDIRKSRGKKSYIPRDNVMFEMGMFVGSLGLTRAYLIVEDECKLPTDYNGVTVSYFQKDKDGSLDIATEKIIEAIKNTQRSFNLRPVPSAALALGYFESFIQPLAKKRIELNIEFNVQVLLPENINDIPTQINIYKAKNPSEEIRINNNESRPSIHQLMGTDHQYWDIPTTLSTLHRLMDLIMPTVEIGINQEKQDWVNHELRNFQGTLNVLIEQCTACKGRISVIKLSS